MANLPGQILEVLRDQRMSLSQVSTYSALISNRKRYDLYNQDLVKIFSKKNSKIFRNFFENFENFSYVSFFRIFFQK